MDEELKRALLDWYHATARPLPWRGEKDPYRILVAEVLLQQTRTEQAAVYYHHFLERFPTLEALAEASLEEVLKVWAGAGYYARARNLHRLAQSVKALPGRYEELLRLPGIGPYTAAAVASLAFGEAVGVVDGNVRRVLARFFAWENPGPALLQRLANELVQGVGPAEWNQALMDLGALVCTPKRPLCGACPLGPDCRGRGKPEAYPKPKKRVQREEMLWALVLVGPGGVYLEEAKTKRYGGLYGIPLLSEEAFWKKAGTLGVVPRFLGEVRHELTHRRLRVQVYGASLEQPLDGFQDPSARPLSKLTEKILAKALPLLAHPPVVPLLNAKAKGV
ncbi:MAG: A/G-specific adenine glycosylase [Thermaceae bacterium]